MNIRWNIDPARIAEAIERHREGLTDEDWERIRNDPGVHPPWRQRTGGRNVRINPVRDHGSQDRHIQISWRPEYASYPGSAPDVGSGSRGLPEDRRANDGDGPGVHGDSEGVQPVIDDPPRAQPGQCATPGHAAVRGAATKAAEEAEPPQQLADALRELEWFVITLPPVQWLAGGLLKVVTWWRRKRDR